MITPAVAPVRPRVLSLSTGEPLLLEDVVESAARKSKFQAMRLDGRPGSGKTTALCHLAATISPELGVEFLDDAEPQQVEARAKSGFVVYCSDARSATGVVQTLATWTDDDLIEYLLNAHPEQVKSVFARISAAHDRRSIPGIPELWTAIIDEMSADASITSIGEAIVHAVRQAMPEGTTIQAVGDFCIYALKVQSRYATRSVLHFGRGSVSAQHASSLSTLNRLLRHGEVQTIFAAERLARQLKSGDPVTLLVPITLRIVEELAKRVGSDQPAIDQLNRLADGLFLSAPLAASILHALDRGRHPTSQSAHLVGARCSDASWNRIQLTNADLSRADVSASDLSRCGLHDVIAKDATFEDTTFDRGCISCSNLSRADLRNCSLIGIWGIDVTFTRADLRSADFSEAALQRCDFTDADLREADFSDAQLNGCVLSRAEIEGTDLRNAQLRKADLAGLPIRKALVDGADFAGARLAGCDLEYVRLSRVNFREANLWRAHLTGSKMSHVDFRGANLRGTGLGDIDWEGADLREADLVGSSFHMGSTRCGLVGSPYPSHGTRTGFYTDDYDDQYFKAPEEIRKANLRGADLRGAIITGVDFYLVDLRDAQCDDDQLDHLRRTGAILQSRTSE